MASVYLSVGRCVRGADAIALAPRCQGRHRTRAHTKHRTAAGCRAWLIAEIFTRGVHARGMP